MRTKRPFRLASLLVIALVTAVGMFASLKVNADTPPPESTVPPKQESAASPGQGDSGVVATSLPSGDVNAGEQALAEVSIDVNPLNRANQVIVGHSPTLTTMNTFFTLDAGASWTPVPLGDAQDGLASTFRFDPTVAFDDISNVYVAYGVKRTGPNRITVVVAKSADGGQNYTQFTQVATTNDIGTLPGNDKWPPARILSLRPSRMCTSPGPRT